MKPGSCRIAQDRGGRAASTADNAVAAAIARPLGKPLNSRFSDIITDSETTVLYLCVSQDN